MQKILLLLATVLALPPTLALGQTTEELNNDGKNPENVLTQSMGLARNSYSPHHKDKQEKRAKSQVI